MNSHAGAALACAPAATPKKQITGKKEMRKSTGFSLNIPYYSGEACRHSHRDLIGKDLPNYGMETVPGVAAKGGSGCRGSSPGTTPLPGRERCPCPSWHSPTRVGVELGAKKTIPSSRGESDSEKEPKHCGKTWVCSGVGEWEKSARLALSDGGRS